MQTQGHAADVTEVILPAPVEVSYAGEGGSITGRTAQPLFRKLCFLGVRINWILPFLEYWGFRDKDVMNVVQLIWDKSAMVADWKQPSLFLDLSRVRPCVEFVSLSVCIPSLSEYKHVYVCGAMRSPSESKWKVRTCLNFHLWVYDKPVMRSEMVSLQ